VITVHNHGNDLAQLVHLGFADWEPDPKDGIMRLTPAPVVVDIAVDYCIGHKHPLMSSLCSILC
jgi:hypothetical protein